MKRHLLAVAVLAATMVAGVAAPAAAETNLLTIGSYDTGQCADVYLGNRQSGARVASEPCLQYSEQYWRVFLSPDNSGSFMFKNYLTDKCLATSNGSGDGTAIATNCQGGAEQEWTYNGTRTTTLPKPGPYRYHFVNRRSGRLLQSGGVNGASLLVKGYDYSNDQLWVVNN